VEERFGEAAQLTDKLLSNVHRVGAIVRALPQAAIVHVERNALDVAWSCWRAQLDGESAWSASPEGIACYLKYFTTAMRTWDELYPGRITRVAYEDLVRHPGATIPSMLKACGLPEEPAALEPHRSRRPVVTLSYAQVREPIHARSINAARDFPLASRALVRALEREGLGAACH
jgi:LPS sulfotransferase NodH